MHRVLLFLQLNIFVYIKVASQGHDLLTSNRVCGYQHTDDYREGIPRQGAVIDEFPWLAALIYSFKDNTRVILCNGALISERYVLTAAHCLALPRETELVGVRLGEYNLTTEIDCVYYDSLQPLECAFLKDYGLEEMIIHPEYKQRTRENDIALLRLDKEVLFSDSEYVRPICLDRQAPSTRTLYVSGFGKSTENGSPAEVKKKILASVVPNRDCAKVYPKSIIDGSQMCFKDDAANVEWTCIGDGGAPLMYATRKVPQWYLEGLVSWGSGCGPNHTHVVTRVSPYLEWIQSNLIE